MYAYPTSTYCYHPENVTDSNHEYKDSAHTYWQATAKSEKFTYTQIHIIMNDGDDCDVVVGCGPEIIFYLSQIRGIIVWLIIYKYIITSISITILYNQFVDNSVLPGVRLG